MRSWENRSKEIAYLLNPAYCGKILYSSIKNTMRLLKEAISHLR